jgi:PqqD family protein of HPr-rel-A system
VAAMKPKIRSDLAMVEVEGEIVVYDPAAGDLHYLNPTASIVYRLCDGTGTVKELSADMADAFGIPPNEMERQVRSLMRKFRKAGILVPNQKGKPGG